MNNSKFFKFLGMASGLFGGFLILMGIIGFFTGSFWFVKYYRYWFLFAIPFLVFGIFGMLVFIGCKDKDDK